MENKKLMDAFLAVSLFLQNDRDNKRIKNPQGIKNSDIEAIKEMTVGQILTQLTAHRDDQR